MSEANCPMGPAEVILFKSRKELQTNVLGLIERLTTFPDISGVLIGPSMAQECRVGLCVVLLVLFV